MSILLYLSGFEILKLTSSLEIPSISDLFNFRKTEKSFINEKKTGVTDLVPGDLVPPILSLRFGAYNLVPGRFSAWEI